MLHTDDIFSRIGMDRDEEYCDRSVTGDRAVGSATWR